MRNERGGGMSVERAASGMAGRDPDSGFLGGLVRARERETREREGERTGAPPLGAWGRSRPANGEHARDSRRSLISGFENSEGF